MLGEFEETIFPTHLNLKFFQWRVRGMYFDIWRSISYNKEWENEKKTRKERKKRLKLQTRRGHSTVRVLSTRQERLLLWLSLSFYLPSDPFWRAQPNEVNTLCRRRDPLARDLISLPLSLSLARSLVEHPNGATDQGLVAAWRLAPRVVGIPKFRAFILFPFGKPKKYFSSSSCLPPWSLARFCSHLPTRKDSQKRVCQVTWPGSQ